MKRLLIVLGLFASLTAFGQGTIQTLRDSGDSTAVKVSNLYLYGVAGSTEYVVRPAGVFLHLEDSTTVWVTMDQLRDTAALFMRETNPEFAGLLTVGDAVVDETELEILDGALLSTTELNYVDGVTSSIQT